VAVRVRPAGPADDDFLAEMLVAAACWRLDGPLGDVHSVLTRPELAHYVSGWPRPGDLGVVAEDGLPVGAAWLRLLPEHDRGPTPGDVGVVAWLLDDHGPDIELVDR